MKIDLLSSYSFKTKKAAQNAGARGKRKGNVSSARASAAAKKPRQPKLGEINYESRSAQADGTAGALDDKSSSTARRYKQAERVSVLFTMEGGYPRKKQWFDGQVVFKEGMEKSDCFSIVFDDGDKLFVNGPVWTFQNERWNTQQLIKRLEDSELGSAGEVSDMSMLGCDDARASSLYSVTEEKIDGDEHQDEDGFDGEEEKEEDELEVEKIMRSRYNKQQRRTEYLVRWSGYGPGDDTWEPLENLGDSEALLAEFESRSSDNSQKQIEDGLVRHQQAERDTSLRNHSWAPAELQRLNEMVREHGAGDWNTKAAAINAEFYPDGSVVRTRNSLCHAYNKYIRYDQSTEAAVASAETNVAEKCVALPRPKVWTKAELQQLGNLIAKDGIGDWQAKADAINAEFHPDGSIARTKQAVYLAFYTYLRDKKPAATTNETHVAEKRKALPAANTAGLDSGVAKKKKYQQTAGRSSEVVQSSPIVAVLGKRWKHPPPAKPGTYSIKPPLVGGGSSQHVLKTGAVLQYLVQRGSASRNKHVATVSTKRSVSDDAADVSAGRNWENADSFRLIQERAVIDYERKIADAGGELLHSLLRFQICIHYEQHDKCIWLTSRCYYRCFCSLPHSSPWLPVCARAPQVFRRGLSSSLSATSVLRLQTRQILNTFAVMSLLVLPLHGNLIVSI
eukprot:COSAG02_NODE_4039_length_5874_cov_4.662165_5_plen_678_part_00